MTGGYHDGNAAPPTSAKAAHVNMMTDCVIANLPLEGLREVMRGMLGTDVDATPRFHMLASKYLRATEPELIPSLFIVNTGSIELSPTFAIFQGRYRCLMGCGFGFQCMEALTQLACQMTSLDKNTFSGEVSKTLATIDGDIVQAVTAIQKKLTTCRGLRSLEDEELKVIQSLKSALISCIGKDGTQDDDFQFSRGLLCLEKLLGQTGNSHLKMTVGQASMKKHKSILETTVLGSTSVPRMFMGLWQFSSPAWGSASQTRINDHFTKHVEAGLVAFDMADHYGDAEVTFGQFRASRADGNIMYCATKWAVFEPIQVSKEIVSANISDRLASINSESLELLQFHWQDYNDHQYVQAASWILEDSRVQSLGLCNFDTQRMTEIIQEGVNIVSNQVQFSLIDIRPTFRMAQICKKHNVKLLTYGTLCGGFLADKWLGKKAPNLFDSDMTPSHRKYFEMIEVWGGWSLFQELLAVLASLGSKHLTSISNIAVRWVLEHDYVGAVIVGARMGVSEHVEDNLRVFSFRLDEEDMAKIRTVIDKSKARDVFEAMGDCGSEYRT